MNYEKKYKEAIERMKSWARGEHPECFSEAQKAAEFVFPELKESEDEKIRGAIIDHLKDNNLTEWAVWLEKQKSVREIVERCKNSWYNEGKIDGMAEGLTNDEKYQQGWHDALEKQGKSITIDIDKMVLKYSQTRETCTNGLPVNCQIRAYRQGINDALRLSLNPEKQEPIDKNKLAKGVLRGIATSIMKWLDANVVEGNMCLSNMECEDIENAVRNADWMKVYQYMKKKLEKQGEQKPTVVDFNAKDWYVSKVDGKLHNIYQSVDKIEQKPTSDTKYEVKAGGSLSANGQPFDYEHATITQKDFAPINVTDEGIVEAIKNTSVLDMIEQKQEWSEEDEKIANDLIKGCLSSVSPYQLTHTCQEIADWLKSIKDRMKGKEDKQ